MPSGDAGRIIPGRIAMIRALLVLGLVLGLCGLAVADDQVDVFSAATDGNLDVVKQLLDATPGLLNAQDDSGRTPLIYAAANGHAPVVKMLLERGAKANLPDKELVTPLHWAAGMGQAAIVQLLLDKGAKDSLDALDLNGKRPRDWAASQGHPEVAALLDAAKPAGPGKPAVNPIVRQMQLKQALALLGDARSCTLNWSITELTEAAVAAATPATLEADCQAANGRGLGDGLLDLARRKAKISGIDAVILGLAQPTALARVRELLGAEDAAIPDQWRDPAQPAEAPRPIVWHTYNWVSFGTMGEQIQAVRADCRKLPTDGGNPLAPPLITEPIQTASRTNAPDGAEMLLIPAGEFLMGSRMDRKDQRPQRKVTLDAYWIYKNPVTVAQYKKFVQATHRQMPAAPHWGWNDNDPIVNITWDEAYGYAHWAGGQLPTEAEWEKAARGPDGRRYPWGNDWDAAKCNAKGGPAKAVAVGSFPDGASPYGVLDMLGNVTQWCQDWYDSTYYYKANTSINPQGPPTAPDVVKNYGVTPSRVVRGGSFRGDQSKQFCSLRTPIGPLLRSEDRGFRVVVLVEK